MRVFEAELMTGHSPHGSHPTAAFYAGADKITNKGTGRSSTPSQRTCVFCKGSQSPMDCQALESSQARKEFVTEKNLCFNCLGKHRVSAGIAAVSAIVSTIQVFVLMLVRRSRKPLNLTLSPSQLPPRHP